jgi:hypothetical protein
MDFIERIFQVSPDHGDGTFEVAILTICILLLCFAVFRMLRRSGWLKSNSRRQPERPQTPVSAMWYFSSKAKD